MRMPHHRRRMHSWQFSCCCAALTHLAALISAAAAAAPSPLRRAITVPSFILPSRPLSASFRRRPSSLPLAAGKGRASVGGYHWVEDNVKIDVHFPLDGHPAVQPADVSLKTTTTSINLSLKGRPLLRGPLRGRTDPDETLWVFDEGEGGERELVVSLPKNEVRDAENRNDWFGVVRGDSAVSIDYMYYDDGGQYEYRRVKGEDFAAQLVQQVMELDDREQPSVLDDFDCEPRKALGLPD